MNLAHTRIQPLSLGGLGLGTLNERRVLLHEHGRPCVCEAEHRVRRCEGRVNTNRLLKEGRRGVGVRSLLRPMSALTKVEAALQVQVVRFRALLIPSCRPGLHLSQFHTEARRNLAGVVSRFVLKRP